MSSDGLGKLKPEDFNTENISREINQLTIQRPIIPSGNRRTPDIQQDAPAD